MNQPRTASREAHWRSKITPCSTAGSTSMVSRIGHLRAGALSSIESASPGTGSMFHWGMGGSRLRRRVALRKASHQPPHSAGLAGRACKCKGGQEVALQRKCWHIQSTSTYMLEAHEPLQLSGQQVQGICWSSSPAPPHRDGGLCLRCTTPPRGPPGGAPPRRALPQLESGVTAGAAGKQRGVKPARDVACPQNARRGSDLREATLPRLQGQQAQLQAGVQEMQPVLE